MKLVITIPEEPPFYSLFAEGPYLYKEFEKKKRVTLFTYGENDVVVLYYTYPSYREACVIRNVSSPSGTFLPGLSKRVSLLFSVRASRVDKLKRAAGFLKEHSGSACSFGDGFYTRLYFIICRRGKLNYPALQELCHDYPD
jgi:hypothetical protein